MLQLQTKKQKHFMQRAVSVVNTRILEKEMEWSGLVHGTSLGIIPKTSNQVSCSGTTLQHPHGICEEKKLFVHTERHIEQTVDINISFLPRKKKKNTIISIYHCPRATSLLETKYM